MKFFLAVYSVLALICFASAKHSFNNYKLIRVHAHDADTLKVLNDLELQDPNFDIWQKGDDMTLDVLLSPSAFEEYQGMLQSKDVSLEVVVDDFQKVLDEEATSIAKKAKSNSILLTYARYGDIQKFVRDVVTNNPEIASSYLAGTTYQKRELNVLVLKTDTSSRSIWIDCGIHAREWVTPATCVYIIDQLVEGHRNQDPEILKLLEKYEFHILPLLNPDGYEYTHTTYRLWRKNRSPNTGSSCIGTDLNRNYDYRWKTGGSSSNPCSDTYAGAVADSELETKAVINSINKKLGQWDAFLSLHSYGNWWLTPWGYSSVDRPSDYKEVVAKGQIGADAIKKFNGTVFTVGSSASLLYINSGSSKDWAKGAANIKYSYVLELRPGSGTPDISYGFALPVDRMPLVAPETWVGIKAFLNSI